MKLWKPLAFLTLVSALFLPRIGKAQQNFEGWVKGAYAQNAKVNLINPSNDTITATAGFYSPQLDAYYWSKTVPNGWIGPGDTCDFYIRDSLDSGKRQDLWTIVGGSTNSIITANLDKNLWNYSIDVTNVTGGVSDTLIEADVRVKHQGRWSDAVRDTFNTTTSYDDISLNIAKSDSVGDVWTNGGTNPNNIDRDSVVVIARSLNNNNMVGSSRGIILGFWYNYPSSTGGGSGDHLPDITLQVGVPEDKSLENKVQKTFDVCPSHGSTFNVKNYRGKVSIYDETGKEVGVSMIQDGRLNLVYLPAGVYFVKLEDSKDSIKKVVKLE